MDKPGADGLSKTAEECVNACTSVQKSGDVNVPKHKFLPNVVLPAGSSISQTQLLSLVDQLAESREVHAMLRADVDKLIAVLQLIRKRLKALV